MRTSLIWLCVLMLPVLGQAAAAQTSAAPVDTVATAKELLAKQRWEEVIRLAESSTNRTPDLDYCYGMALARLQRWDEAARVFKAAARNVPADKRFPIELAGIAFERKRYGEAIAELKKALRLDPRDNYANDFLGTIYFLQDNIPAALKYWNRIGKPMLANVASDPQPRTDPALLDRALAFSPAGILKAEEFQLTRERLDLLQVFPSYRLELQPKQDGAFDLFFHSSERNGWGATRLEGLVALFRNLPFQTINPEVFNIGHSAANFVSVVRWDSNKQRLFTSFSSPLRGDPKWRYGVSADLRNEHWNLASSAPSLAPGGNLIFKKAEAAADIESIVTARFTWKTGISLSQRTFTGSGFDSTFTNQFFRNGLELKYSGGISAELLNAPERRFTAKADFGVQLGRLWDTRNTSFAKTTGAFRTLWLPVARGDDYRTSTQFRWGKSLGQTPFDELFMLGMERDNDLWMRAHPGTRDGMKGSAPLGRDYVLVNWELDKNLRRAALFKISVGPFVDTGRFFDQPPDFGSRQWLCDVGIQTKVRIFGGVGVVLSYGKDVRSGKNAFYAAGLQ